MPLYWTDDHGRTYRRRTTYHPADRPTPVRETERPAARNWAACLLWSAALLAGLAYWFTL